MTLKLGVCLPQAVFYDLSRDVTTAAQRAERIGFDSVWVFERPLFPDPMTQGLYGIPGLPWPDHYRGVADPLITLALAAAVTTKVELGTSVLVAPLHGSTQLARALASLDNASGGRVVAGLGTGWSLDEFAAAGVVPFENRGQALDELLDVCAAVWGPDPVSFTGEFTQIAPSQVGPKPRRPIPIHLAGTTPAALRRVAKRADAWMPVALGPSALADGWARVQDYAAQAGRREPVDISLRVNVHYSKDRDTTEGRYPGAGNLEQIVEDITAHCEAAPVTDVFVDVTAILHDSDAMMDVAEELHSMLRTI